MRYCVGSLGACVGSSFRTVFIHPVLCWCMQYHVGACGTILVYLVLYYFSDTVLVHVVLC